MTCWAKSSLTEILRFTEQVLSMQYTVVQKLPKYATMLSYIASETQGFAVNNC